MPGPTPTKREALTILERGHREVGRLIEQLPPRTLATTGIGGGAWSPADLLGHLAAWEGFALAALHAWDRRERAPIDIALDARGLNGVNADALAEASARTPAQRRKGYRTDARGVGRGRPRGSRGSVGQAPVHARPPARSAPRLDPGRTRRPVPARRRAPAGSPRVRGDPRAPLVGCRHTTHRTVTGGTRHGHRRSPRHIGPTGRARQGHPRGRRKHRHDQEAVRLDRARIPPRTTDVRYREMLFTTPGLARARQRRDPVRRDDPAVGDRRLPFAGGARRSLGDHPGHQGRYRREGARGVPRARP